MPILNPRSRPDQPPPAPARAAEPSLAQLALPPELIRTAIYASLAAILIAAMIIGICVGQYPVALSTVWSVITRWPGEVAPTVMDERIVMLVRGPRVVLAALCGAGLALTGAAMQGVFRNPLASPELLGVSSGAAFGGATVILIGLSGVTLVGIAFAGGLIALGLVGLVTHVAGRTETTTVILAGVIVGAFFSALVSIVQLFADPHNSLPTIVFWLMGSFATTTWSKVIMVAPAILAGAATLWLMRFRINVLSLGDEEASMLGVAIERDRWLIFLATALIVGATVAVAGVIGWVGIVIPHVARLLIGHDHRHLLPASALLGAAYLCLIDTVARSATATDAPIGVLTAVIGAPFVALLLRKRQRNREVAQ